MAELVSQAEAARRLDVTPQAVNRLVKRGKLPLVNGKIHIETAREVLAQRLDPLRSKILRNSAEADSSTQGPASGNERALMIDYASAKARREHYEGLRSKLEYELRCGELVERKAVEAAAFRPRA